MIYFKSFRTLIESVLNVYFIKSLRIHNFFKEYKSASAAKSSFYVKDCGMVGKKRAKRTKNVLQCPMC